MDAVAAMVRGGRAEIEVERSVVRDGQVVEELSQQFTADSGRCTGDSFAFRYVPPDDHNWIAGQSIGMVETHIRLVNDGPYFSGQISPGFIRCTMARAARRF